MILKKSFAISLIGFIFIINTIPVSFGQTYSCPLGTPYQLSDGSKTICKLSDPQQIGGSWICTQGTAYKYATPLQSGQTIEACGAEQLVTTDAPTQIKETDLKSIGKVTTTYKAKVEIPCNTKISGGTCPKDWQTSISSYITRLYQFGLMISGLVALGVIMYGAVLYTLSAGNVASKEEGKEWMKSAIYGVVLLFGAYLILYTINPNLVRLSNPDISPVNLSDYEPEQVYVPDSGFGNNTVNQGGGSAIPGCEISSSGALGLFDDFVTLDVNGQQVASTGDAGSFKCQKCFDGYTLKDGKCEANK